MSLIFRLATWVENISQPIATWLVDLDEAHELFKLRRWCWRNPDRKAVHFVVFGLFPGLAAQDYTGNDDKGVWAYLADELTRSGVHARRCAGQFTPLEVERLGKLWDELQKEEYAPDADEK